MSDSTSNFEHHKYKGGELSEAVIASLVSCLEKLKSKDLKEIILNLVPKISNLDKFVVNKIKNQLAKHRIIELNNKKLGKIGIQYRYDGVQIEPVGGFLSLFIKKITISDEQIIKSFDNILKQIKEKYIIDNKYLIQKIDDIIFNLSHAEIYKFKSSEEKTLYDLAMILLANYYSHEKEIPDWFEQAVKNLKKNEFVKSWLDFLIEYISEIIAQVSENLFFDFKIMLNSKILRLFLNQKTNRGQFSKILKLLDINIKEIIYKFSKSYISPSFITGMSELLVNLINYFLSQDNDISFNNNLNLTEAFNITVCFGKNPLKDRAIRWFTSDLLKNCYIEYSGSKKFKNSKKINSTLKKVKKTVSTLNFGLVSGYKIVDFIQHSVVLENINNNKIYYRICCDNNNFKSKIYELSTKNTNDSFEFTIFTDSQGMIEQDYNIFLKLLKNSLKSKKTDFIIHLGDFVDDGSNEEYWTWVLNSKIWKENVCVPVCGNHDVRVNYLLKKCNFENSILSHFNIQNFPNQEISTGTYYSFEYNNTIFVVLNTNFCEYDSYIDNSQYTWALSVLLKSKAKWKIILTHKSPYSNGPHCNDEDVKKVGKKIIDLAYQAKVDVIFGGHDHVYVRTPEMNYSQKVLCEKKYYDYNEQKYVNLNPYGSIFIVPGTSGVKNYKFLNKPIFPVEQNLEVKSPVYSSVKITNSRLYFESFMFDINKKSFKLIDYICIEKNKQTHNINSNLIINMINSIPSDPCINRTSDLEKVLNLYKKLDYTEKIKVTNSEKLFNFINTNNKYLKIISNNIKRVSNKTEFLDAIKDINIGTIILDCDEIKFGNKLNKNYKIVINRPMCIRGTAKLTNITFVISDNSMLILSDNLYINNKFYNIIELNDNSILSINNNVILNFNKKTSQNHNGISILGEKYFIYKN